MAKISQDKSPALHIGVLHWQANNGFCKALEKNRELREQIDNLRVNRNRFENLYKKLEKELKQLKQETAEVVDQSTSAYDQRYMSW